MQVPPPPYLGGSQSEPWGCGLRAWASISQCGVGGRALKKCHLSLAPIQCSGPLSTRNSLRPSNSAPPPAVSANSLLSWFSGGGEWLVTISHWPFGDSGTHLWPGHPPCSPGCDHHVRLWAERAETDRQTAGPWTQGRKALLTSRFCACVMGPAHVLSSPSSPSLIPLVRAPHHAAGCPRRG